MEKKIVHGETKQIDPKYKDGIFRLLFNDEKLLRQLYNDLRGTDYGEDVPITIRTLQDVIYIDIKNDIAFTIGDKFVVLLEAQSSLCMNMPVRMLSYIGRLYEKMYDRSVFYRKSLVKLPTPEFYVLYNGKDDLPAEMELRLSHSFAEAAPENSAELVVKVYNIKYNKGAEIIKKNKALYEYSLLVSYMENFLEEGVSVEEAAKLTIRRCIDEGIMREFLQIHGSEVVGMLFDYITKEEYAELRGEEQYDIGFEKGIQEGIEQRTIQIALAMRTENMDSETIARVTGLSPEIIENL